ncbi:hypothetical protein RU639_013489 [Aspergillus parasiticus]
MPAFAPFDASKYAFRTNFDGLAASDPASSACVEDAKIHYQDALKKFENEDKKAREEYQQAKNAGLTTESFEDWVLSNFPQWPSAKNELQANGARLSNAGMNAFGYTYMERCQQRQADLIAAALRAGYQPEQF